MTCKGRDEAVNCPCRAENIGDFSVAPLRLFADHAVVVCLRSGIKASVVLPPEWQAPLCKDWFAVRAFVWSGITGFQVRVLPDRNCGCRESPCEPPGDFTSKRRR